MGIKSFSIIQARWPADKVKLQLIRTAVFVTEQSVPKHLEWDNQDDKALHVMALDHSANPVGTGRLLASGQIGRMAVLKSWRNKGVGSSILKELIKIATSQHIDALYLNAQYSAIPFYLAHGFHPVGDPFIEAGIKHHRMKMG